METEIDITRPSLTECRALYQKFQYLCPKTGQETYAEYRDRVTKMKDQGFNIGLLSDNDYIIYCKGSGQYDNWDENQRIL